MNLLSAELMKLRTLRTPWILLGVSGLIALIALAVQIAIIEDQPGDPTLSGPGMAGLLGGAASACLMALIIGAVGSTGELNHRTEYLNYLVSPTRIPAVLSRVTAYLLFGLLFAGVVLMTTTGLAVAWAAIRVGDIPWGSDATRIVLGVLVISAAYMAIGLAVGMVIGNQVVAVVMIIAWPLMIEGIITLPLLLINPKLTALAPFQAAQALLVGDELGGLEISYGTWASAFTVIGWTVVLSAIGIWRTLSRDPR